MMKNGQKMVKDAQVDLKYGKNLDEEYDVSSIAKYKLCSITTLHAFFISNGFFNSACAYKKSLFGLKFCLTVA